MHFAWQAQYKRHVHQRYSEIRVEISWDRLHFGVSELHVGSGDSAWQVEHFVWPGFTFSWKVQYLQTWTEKNATCIGKRPSALLSTFIFGCLAESLSFWCCKIQKINGVSQSCFVFDIVKFQNFCSRAGLLKLWRCQAWDRSIDW